jgi:hypothetical protein
VERREKKRNIKIGETEKLKNESGKRKRV